MKPIHLLNCCILSLTFCLNGLPASAKADILMYNAGPHNGNLGGRASADALCASSQPSRYAQARAFLSVDGTDEIRDMPANYKIPSDESIVGTTDVLIANNWNELLTGSLRTSLGVAVAGMKGASWWSGSTAAGALNSENCSGWSTDAGEQFGGVGLGDHTTSWWIDFDLAFPACQVSSGLFTLSFFGINVDVQVTLNVLCVAYNPTHTDDAEPPSDPPPSEPPPSDPPPSDPPPSEPPVPPTDGNMDPKIFCNGVEIVSTEAILQDNFEDVGLPCGTTSHCELKTGLVTLLAKDITTAACPTVVPQTVSTIPTTISTTASTITSTTTSTTYTTPSLRSDWPVFVEVDGSGSGTVKSNIGIACHTTDCVHVFDDVEGPYAICNPDACTDMVKTLTTVTLTPEPDPGSEFSSWGGHHDCVDGNIIATGGKLCIAYFREKR